VAPLSAPSRRQGQDHPPLYRAKLSRPNLAALVLDRPHLARALADQAGRPLSLVVADAGYGKTTLLTSYVRTLARPVVWYSLMPSDADLIVFSRYLLEGFRREAPRFGKTILRVLEEETRPGAAAAEILAGTFANELAALKGPPWLLVLDDFHEVASSPVTLLMDALLRHLPEKVRVLIASRSTPPLSLDRLRARGQLFELDSSHLRLGRAELDQLFRDVYRRPLGVDELSSLDETTRGWPTAVHLVHEALLRAPDRQLEDVLTRLRASDLDLHDYLTTEVYGRLDADSARMLERTAALSRFDAELAAVLADRRGAGAVLEALARRGLLRSFGGDGHASYECHELVRRVVRQELQGRDGLEGLRRLDADTAGALEARGERERALKHYLLAGRLDDAARLARDLAPSLLRQGRAGALLQALSDLPSDQIHADPPLLLALADAHRATGGWDEAHRLYQEALERARREGNREHECHALSGLGRFFNMRGQHEQVLGLTESGLARSEGVSIETRARLLQIKAAAHFYLGQYRAAIRVLDEVRTLLKSSEDRELLVPVIHNLAMAYVGQGRYREASVELRAALAEVRGTSSPRAPLYLSNLAFLQAELGDLAEARRVAEEGLAAAQRFSNRPHEATCRWALAQIAAQSGDFDGALAGLKQVEEMNAELRMELVAADLLALRGRIFCGRGEYRRAVTFLTEAIERVATRPGDPRGIELTTTLAWCELRAGRVRAAKELLEPLVARADADENEHRRMRVHYWMGEVRVALGERRAAEKHLAVALALVRERGYHAFLKSQAREESAPLLHALACGIETDIVTAALVDAGVPIEEELLAILEASPPAIAEAVVTVLGEVGSPASRDRLEKQATKRRALRPAIKTALRHIAERAARGSTASKAEPTASAQLLLFGPPRLQIDERPVPASAWRAQRAFQMLVYLALHPRGAGKDDLLERFWPGRLAAAGRRNFHPTLSYIRSVLPAAKDPAILREAEFYRLNPAYPLSCDAWEFDRALEEARRARGDAERRDALQRAAALASGPFLEGIYADWADELQPRTRDRIEKCLLDLGALCAKAGDHEEALGHFRRAAEIDAYRETTWLATIECLVKLGNRRAAVAEYARLESLLRKELGVDPLPETREALKALLKDAAPGLGDENEEMVESNGPQPITASAQVSVKRPVRS
jgi:LuxR family transcriptional regulator, maltose regulon positive regulatory protein